MNYKTTIVQKEMKSSILYIDAANSINDIRIAEKSIWVENIPKYGYNMFYLLFTNKKNKIEKNVLNNIISSRKYNSYLLSYIVLTYNLIKTLKTSKPSFVIVRNRADIGVIVLCLGKFFKFKSVYIKAFPQLELMISKTSNKLRILVLKLVLQWEIFLMKRSDILIVRSKKHDLLLKEKYRIRRNTLIISMGVNMALLKEINQETKERIRTDYGLSKAFLGVYFGVLGKGRKIEFIIDIIKDVQTNHSNLDFLIIGGEQNGRERKAMVWLKSYMASEKSLVPNKFENYSNNIEPRFNDDIKIYPNPVDDYLTIKGKDIRGIKILDISGKNIRSVFESETFSVQDLNKGVYILKIEYDSYIEMRKFMKR